MSRRSNLTASFGGAPWALAITLAVAIALPRLAAAQLMSPGPLANAHASLEGDSNCTKCHESGKQVVSKLCLDCHKDLAAEMAASRGLHGIAYRIQACESCHHEHIGRNTKLVRWPGGAMEKLDHDLTGYKLEGGHGKVACLKCHTKTSPLGKPQFLGTKTACESCHKDPHGGRFGTDCKRCHGVTAEWKAFEQKAFDHKVTRYPLTGKHTAVTCDKCHTGTPPRWKPLEFSTCENCHQDPHKGQFKPKPCAGCHDTASWEGAMDSMRANHPGLSLANGHAKVACEKCHDKGNNKTPSKGKTCVGCHRNVHVAKFGTDCKDCHASIRWSGLPESIGRDHHDQTRYRLAGRHTSVDCARCHPTTKPLARRYRGIAFRACLSCHADEHNGEFAARDKGECGACHTVAGFAPTKFGVTEHATTKFALEGKHVATPCASCHPAKRPRLSFVVAKQVCADCHANPHGTQFDAEMAQGGCAKCHTPIDWHQAKIDHSTFPLVGAHARTPCTACHGEQKKGAEPAAYRGIPRTCEGCHDDIHAGQFRQTQPQKDCRTCHAEESFQIAKTFDHGKTRYPLDGKHRGLACNACHPKETLRNGGMAVRWRLGYMRCKDCHANPHREGP